MADRKVTFTLGTKVDPQAKREAAELASLLQSIQKAADGATKSVRSALEASSRGRGGPASGGGGASPSGGPRSSRGRSAGLDAGYDRAAIDDLKRQRADERKEREGILADRRKEMEAERKLLAERVRANVEASKKIRDAAKEAKAENYRARAAGTYGAGFGGGGPSGPSIPSDDLKRQRADERKEREGILADRRKEMEAERKLLAERVRANVEASKKIRDAAKEAKAENYRARAAGTYGAGFGGGGPSGPSIPSDDDFKKHIEGIAKAQEQAQKASERAAAAHRKNMGELISGSKQAAAGIGNIARSFVYLGVSGEKNIEAAVRLLAKFEAGMAGVRGASDLIGGLAKAGRASRALGSGAGLAAGIGAAGFAGTAGLVAGAGAVGAGVGFGVGRLAIGGESFGRMTDWAGITDYAGDRREASKAIIAKGANRQIARRNKITSDYNVFAKEGEADLQYAEGTGGLGAAMLQSRKNADAARARSQDLDRRINVGQAGDYETQTAEIAAAKQNEVTALNAALQIEERRKNVLKQTVEAEKEKTKAVKDGLEASKASLGLADDQTVKLAERGAAKRAKGERLSREEAGALGQFFGEAGQQEAAKLGEDVLKKSPELAKLAEEIAKSRAAKEKEVLVKIEQELTGNITVSPDSAKLMSDIEAVVKLLEEQRRAKIKETLEAEQRDADARATLQRGSSGN